MARTDQPHKLRFADFVSRATDPNNPANEKHVRIDYSRPETEAAFNGRKSKVPLWCSVHEHFFIQQVGNHLNGQGCPECSAIVKVDKRRKVNPIADFQLVHGDKYDYSQVVYKDTHSRVDIICRMHGVFSQEPNAHLRGVGCPACDREAKIVRGAARTAEFTRTFLARANQTHAGAYTYVKLPNCSTDTVTAVCPTHGEFTGVAYAHLFGTGCPTCGKVIPKTQLELQNWVESLGVMVIGDDKNVLGGKHIDIYIPSLRLGIEYHGSYWHTKARRGNLHREKWQLARVAGVRLIQVFDFEWLQRRDAVKNRVAAAVGVAPRFYARRLALREVPRTDAKCFFDKVHTQGGSPRADMVLGLYEGDTLRAAAAFGDSRFSGRGTELLRYASEGVVIGGFQKLLKHYRKNNPLEQIISYCDLRWGTGRMYEKAGFKLSHITDPDYWYTDGGPTKISRFAAQKRPEGVSEADWAVSEGLDKVLGVGHQVWVLPALDQSAPAC